MSYSAFFDCLRGEGGRFWPLLGAFLPGKIFGLMDLGCAAAVVACTIKTHHRPCEKIVLGGGLMDMFLYFVRRLFFDLKPWLEWALRNWGVTIVLLVVLIYLARRHRHLSRYHYY
jgi:hypothetical protein